jgi:hypothetical protein
MATWQTAVYANKVPAGTGHGDFSTSTHLHAVTGTLPTTLGTNDVINFGYLPNGAVVVGAILKAQSQLDSSGSPTLTFDLGVTGTAQLWKAAITTVGRAAGASSDATIVSAGGLYKNTTGGKVLVIGTVHAQAATAVAGVLEVDIEYYVEDTTGSNP